MKIIDYTEKYKGSKYSNYLSRAIDYIPPKDLLRIGKLNVYDSCPDHYPVIAQGSHYSRSRKEKGDIDIYLDQAFGHLLTYNKPKGILSKISDSIYIHTFGKLNIIHTLFHEVGHQVFENQKKRKTKGTKNQSEKFAENYANELYSKMYPLLSSWYHFFNSIYHLIYSNRIEHDNKMRAKKEL